MNKAEFIQAVAEASNLSKVQAGEAVGAIISVIGKALKKGDRVSLIGFGTFEVRKRAARVGKNPRTGEKIKIKASKLPAFRAGQAFKDAM